LIDRRCRVHRGKWREGGGQFWLPPPRERPVLINGDIVVIHWVFVFVWLNDSITRMGEIAYQRWDGAPARWLAWAANGAGHDGRGAERPAAAELLQSPDHCANLRTVLHRKALITLHLIGSSESRPDKFGQWDKWSFCLIAAKMAAAQERR